MERVSAVSPNVGRKPIPVRRQEWVWLGLIVLLGAALRLIVLGVLHQPVISDGASYMKMAAAVISGQEMSDIYGNRALYSPGYPFALVVPFALFGASPATARATNLALAIASMLLLWWLGRRATGRPLVGLLAVAGFAVLIPSAASIENLQREHLSTPLLLAFLAICLHLLESRRPMLWSLVAGLVFACGLYAGVSVLFTVSAFLAALAWRRLDLRRAVACVMTFGLACALTVAPYLVRNAQVVGAPVFSTNGGINLYVGNNPAATGYFVGIDKTPAAVDWEKDRHVLGELGNDQRLQRTAIDYILSHPVRTAMLDLHKLVYFWLPDIPDAQDEDHGKAITAIRWIGAVQHILILALAVVGLASWRRWTPGLWIVLLAILSFWGTFAAFYMITRYRDPIMPLVLVLAAMPVADLLQRRLPGRANKGAAATS